MLILLLNIIVILLLNIIVILFVLTTYLFTIDQLVGVVETTLVVILLGNSCHRGFPQVFLIFRRFF